MDICGGMIEYPEPKGTTLRLIKTVNHWRLQSFKCPKAKGVRISPIKRRKMRYLFFIREKNPKPKKRKTIIKAVPKSGCLMMTKTLNATKLTGSRKSLKVPFLWFC